MCAPPPLRLPPACVVCVQQKKMVSDAMTHLRNGVSLVTFAEGTRSKTGVLQPFKKGAFRIATGVSQSARQ